MRVSTDRRLTGVLTAALLALVGCDSKSKGTVGGSGSGGTTAGLAAGGQTAREFAESFLKDLGDGKAKESLLTLRFEGKVRRGGKPEADPQEYLSKFKGATFVIPEEGKIGDAVRFHGRAKLPDKSASFSLRVVPNSNGYKVDWLHVSDRQGSEIKTPADPDLAAAQDVVRNFLDVLLGGDLRLARSLMAPAWRARLSPPAPSDVRDGYDYGPGFLDGKLRSWRGEYLAYTFTTEELGPNKDTATFVAQLQAGGQNVPHTVKAAKDPTTGEWLITEFDKQ